MQSAGTVGVSQRFEEEQIKDELKIVTLQKPKKCQQNYNKVD